MELSPKELVQTVIALATGVLLGFGSRGILNRGGAEIVEYDSDDSDVPTTASRTPRENYKLVLCVRTDLKMTKGKIAAQAGHATLGAWKAARTKDPLAIKHWEIQGQPKIALQISSKAQADQLHRNATRLGLPTCMIHDAGRTQVASVSCSRS